MTEAWHRYRLKLGCVGILALCAVLVGSVAGCEQDQTDDAVYVTLTLDQNAKSELGNGDVTLTFIAQKNDGSFCAPKRWRANELAWEMKPACKDEWKDLAAIDTPYTWKINAGGYQWVTVLLELFDIDGTARFRAYRQLVPGGADEWNLQVTADNLCGDVQPWDCCSDGEIFDCVRGNGTESSWNLNALVDVDWCTKSDARSSCP